jgi:AbrB family looped-hinge helix DNA binding protein
MKKTKLYKRHKSFRIQSTVTGKRQITIPKEIYDYFDLKNGDHISFIEKDGQIIFEPTDYEVTCFVCNGTGNLLDKGCFVCSEKGSIDKVLLEENMRFFGFIAHNAFRYHVSIGYKCFSIPIEDGEFYLDYPVLSLDSKEYDADKLVWIRDFLQSKIIQREVENNLDKAYQNRRFLEKGIELSMTLEEEKEDIKSWLKKKMDSYMKENDSPSQ